MEDIKKEVSEYVNKNKSQKQLESHIKTQGIAIKTLSDKLREKRGIILEQKKEITNLKEIIRNQKKLIERLRNE